MHLMILENKRLRTTVRPTGENISIGSSPQCAVHLPDPRISQHQASILKGDDGAWWLEVLDTTLPTCLNRSIQKSRAKLRHADEIELGPFSIRFFIEADKSREEFQRERLAALSKQHGGSLPLGAIIHRSDQAVTVSKEHLEQLTLLGLKLAHVESIRDLMPPVLRAMLRLVEGRRAWIGVRNNERGPFDWALGLNDQGQPCDRPQFSQTMENRCLAHTQYVCCPDVPIGGARSAMAVPLACQSGNLGMLYIENDTADPAYDESALNVFSALACCVARPVENTLRKSTAKRQAVASSEHTIARATQDALTPRAVPQWDELQIAAYRYMGAARCCDYYDVVQLPDKTASIVVARLCVEGMATARYLAEVRSAFRSASLHVDLPHLFCRALNWMLFSDGRSGVDLACVWIQPKSGKLTYCTAGDGVHLRRISGDGSCSALATPGMPAVGRSRAPAYDSASIDLSPGDTVMLATTGINAAAGADGKVFGMNALAETLADGVGDRPGNLLSEFEGEFCEFVSSGACPEDVTVVLSRWR
jgi:serine phosphatase RsbU (regulator of sigma subunit)